MHDVRRPVLEHRPELAAPDQPERNVARLTRGGDDRVHTLQRDQLADEQRSERLSGVPGRAEEPVLGADEADGDVAAGELREEARVRLGVGDDEIGGTERVPVDALERARRKRRWTEAPPVGDERVRERDERVEDDGPPVCRASRRRHIEMAGVADDERVEAARALREEPRLSGGES